MTNETHPAQSITTPSRFRTLTSALLLCADPTWLAFALVISLPALFNLACIVAGHASSRVVRIDQFYFFAGMAIYISVLKWLGWNMLSRHLPADTKRFHHLLFPAEIFCGLALVVAWFYVRNFIAFFWPASFGIVELSALKYAALALHIIAVFATRRIPTRITLLENAPAVFMYTLFALCLFLAFRDVSSALHVQSSDPLCHAFLARMYLQTGTFNNGNPAIYTTGFGAINAVAVTLAPLTFVQAIALQHIVLTLATLSCVTGSIAFALRRNLPLLHAGIIPFLCLFPLYNLRPWDHYEGTPRQAAPALLAALCILPTLYSTLSRAPFFFIQFSVAMLAWLCVALNPVCAPFVLILTPLSLAVFCFQTRRASQSLLRTIVTYFVFVVIIGTVVLACDPYYSRLISSRHNVRPDVAGQTRASQPISFSVTEGAKQIASTPLLAFNVSIEEPFDLFPPLRWLPAAAALFAVAAFTLSRLISKSTTARPLQVGLAAAFIAWIALTSGTAFIIGGLAPNTQSWDCQTLQTYMGLLLLRTQLVALFFILAASSTLLVVTLDAVSVRTKQIVLAAATCTVAAIFPFERVYDLRRSAVTVANTGRLGSVTHDDIKLVAWVDEHLARESGLLALGCTAYHIGPEKHLYPYGGSQAVILYGRLTNICFFSCDPSQKFGFDEYMAHVENGFDAQWFLDHSIRWFYIKGDIRAFDPALDNAIKSGALRPLQTIGDSCIYEINR
ncbi:MAG: hypothetical protein WCT04_10070 [Planctomycetota bacterium]